MKFVVDEEGVASLIAMALELGWKHAVTHLTDQVENFVTEEEGESLAENLKFFFEHATIEYPVDEMSKMIQSIGMRWVNQMRQRERARKMAPLLDARGRPIVAES